MQAAVQSHCTAIRGTLLPETSSDTLATLICPEDMGEKGATGGFHYGIIRWRDPVITVTPASLT